jgi:hypothetical protein
MKVKDIVRVKEKDLIGQYIAKVTETSPEGKKQTMYVIQFPESWGAFDKAEIELVDDYDGPLKKKKAPKKRPAKKSEMLDTPVPHEESSFDPDKPAEVIDGGAGRAPSTADYDRTPAKSSEPVKKLEKLTKTLETKLQKAEEKLKQYQEILKLLRDAKDLEDVKALLRKAKI